MTTRGLFAGMVCYSSAASGYPHRNRAAGHVAGQAQVVDDAETGLVDGTGPVDELMHATTGHRDVEDAHLAMPRAPLDAGHRVAGPVERRKHGVPLVGDERGELGPERQVLLDDDSQPGPEGIAGGVGDRVHRVIEVPQHLGDDGDVDERLEEAERRRERAPPLDDGDGPERVEADVGDARQHDEDAGEDDGGAHSGLPLGTAAFGNPQDFRAADFPPLRSAMSPTRTSFSSRASCSTDRSPASRRTPSLLSLLIPAAMLASPTAFITPASRSISGSRT